MACLGIVICLVQLGNKTQSGDGQMRRLVFRRVTPVAGWRVGQKGKLAHVLTS